MNNTKEEYNTKKKGGRRKNIINYQLSIINWVALLLCSNVALAQAPPDTVLHLQNVEVTGSPFAGLSGGAVKKLEVGNNLSSATGTTADALRQFPSLLTDIEGGLMYRGSTRAGMTLHGVPYGLLEEYNGDMLIQLPALFFNQVSLTAFPPAGAIPDGDAGLLDLSSTAYTKDDPLLQATLGAGLEERYNAGAVLNLHPGRFHITGKYNYRREYRERAFRKTTTNAGGTTDMDNNASARPDIHLADLTVGYDLSARDKLTAYGLYYGMEYDRYGGINNTRLNPAGEVMNKILRHRFNNQQQDAYALEARWEHRFAHPDDRLEVTFNYNHFGYDEDNHFKNEKPETGAILAEDQSYINHKKKNYYGKAAYQKRLTGGWLLQGGYIARFRQEDYRLSALDLTAGAWQPNTSKSNEYTFERQTHLLYASAEKQWDRLTLDAGFQLEHARQEALTVERKDFHLYPRLRLAYATGGADELSLSYIQRAVRPYGTDLNPFIDATDATYIRQGNPELKSEYIQSVELSYRLVRPHVHITPAIYYRNRRNRLMDVAAESGGQTVWRRENLGNCSTVGAELSANWQPARLLRVGLAGNVFRDEIDGRVIGYDAKKSLVCWDVKGNVNLSLTPSTELQVDAFYVSDLLTAQGEIDGRYAVNAGLSQYLLQRRLRLNLSIQNIFDSLEETTTIHTDALQMTQIRNRDPRVAWLTLTVAL